jgi:hypothetical protein
MELEMDLPSIVLASASPRRAELLRQMRVEFKVVQSEVAEIHHEQLTAFEVSQINAYRKARIGGQEASGHARARGGYVGLPRHEIFWETRDFGRGLSDARGVAGPDPSRSDRHVLAAPAGASTKNQR